MKNTRKLFKVILRLHFDGYEKISISYQWAWHVSEAEWLALCDETHNDVPCTRREWEAGELEWWDDCMLYKCDGIYDMCHLVEVLTPEQLDIITRSW